MTVQFSAISPLSPLPVLGGLGKRVELDIDFFSAGGMGSDSSSGLDSDTQPSAFDWVPPEPELVPALIVDADRETRYYLRAKLVMAGIARADEAASGSEALYLLKTRRYQMVLMDVELPDIDGWDLAARVTASRGRPALADSLVLTGHNLSWLGELRGRLAGACTCIKKPLHPVELALLLRNIKPM
jgi:CheY-like chemotaxis protein